MFFNTLFIVKSISSLCEINSCVQGGSDPREIKIKEDGKNRNKTNQTKTKNNNKTQSQNPKPNKQADITAKHRP